MRRPFPPIDAAATLSFRTAAARMRQVSKCQSGAMMVEFAVALPAILALYTGAFTLGDMIACQRKVTVATQQLTDLVARSNVLAPEDVSGILAASAQLLAPYSGAKAAITISEVQINPNSGATVLWSQSLNGSALDTGTAVPLPPQLSHAVPKGCGVLILGQVRYAYTPAVSLGPVQAINLSDVLAMPPRYGPQVTLSGGSAPAGCT